ncbi:MAG: hypothetical protein R3B60_02320 [Candidatus Paceibacterota bacterium]
MRFSFFLVLLFLTTTVTAAGNRPDRSYIHGPVISDRTFNDPMECEDQFLNRGPQFCRPDHLVPEIYNYEEVIDGRDNNRFKHDTDQEVHDL